MERFTRAGLTFEIRDSGPRDGDAVVCLHGFPQDGTSYDAVVPRLVERGLRVLVPDQRGYSPGARPPGRTAYALPALVDDVLALLDQAGVGAAHVVGHDWGGAVAWALAGRHPERVRSLTALSTPHPAALRNP
jgi:pimeloyl-ACP methyl ester carboxylesterase